MIWNNLYFAIELSNKRIYAWKCLEDRIDPYLCVYLVQMVSHYLRKLWRNWIKKQKRQPRRQNIRERLYTICRNCCPAVAGKCMAVLKRIFLRCCSRICGVFSTKCISGVIKINVPLTLSDYIILLWVSFRAKVVTRVVLIGTHRLELMYLRVVTVTTHWYSLPTSPAKLTMTSSSCLLLMILIVSGFAPECTPAVSKVCVDFKLFISIDVGIYV